MSKPIHYGRTKDDWGSPLSSRKLCSHEDVKFDPKLKPRAHPMAGTPTNSKILFLDVNILDSTGIHPYHGDVYVEGERIHSVGSVPNLETIRKDPGVTIIHGKGRTLMSGLGDAHTHLSWNDAALETLGEVGVEEHTIITARSAMTYIDSGYTMCYGAASAKERLDCVIRNAINQGSIPGPRYLANGKEIARRGGELTPAITTFADGALEMREVIRHLAKVGVDQIKLSMSGEEIMEARAAEDCFFEDDETAACVDEAHRHGLRVCSHARAKDSISQCVRHGVDIIYHGSYIDEPTMDELERKKHRHIVAPGINWLYATVHEAAPFGYSFDQAEQAGYKKELEIAIRACKEMHQRGITVLPGGDYGFAWTPHGTYARDIEHFVKLLDFTPMEAILSATAGVAKLFMQEDELGKVQPGYFADMILVDGNPLEDIAILQDHSKLNVIMINGRIHKASPSDIQLSGDSFTNGISTVKPTQRFCNYVAYLDNLERSRIGHLDFDSLMITPIVMLSGAPVTSIYQIIELDGAVVAFGESFPSSSVSMQAPISDRDILAVGKNYTDHALEYNRSGYDLIDKNIQPDYPIIFTKRSTSIIGCGQQIRTHSGFTNTLDYEGEIGVIIGKTGFRVSEKDAMEYVWGYTLINDITARERQRDHKQFYIGKSADTFCPMGPVAVPADNLPKNIRLQTFVNGEKRQDAELNDLIFSIPELIKVISEGQTIRPGDIIATGTPAGVGLGQKPPQYLKSGDEVEIAATGLGRLQNRVVDHHDEKGLKTFVALDTHLSTLNLECTAGGSGLTKIGNKMVHLRKVGNGPKIGVFVHGLGASSEFYTPIIKNGDFEECYTSYLYDLEGHGLSPTNIESVVSIESLAEDLKNVVQHTGASQITLFGHSLGCVIAQAFCMKNIDKVEKMVLMGPPPLPLPKPAKSIMATRAATVRDMGMLKSGATDTVSNLGTSTATKMYNPVAIAALRASLLATNPEGYAKACSAVASVNSQFDVEKFKIPILLIAADEDKTSPVQAVRDLHARISSSRMEILNCTGHWHVYENPEGVNRLIRSFL